MHHATRELMRGLRKSDISLSLDSEFIHYDVTGGFDISDNACLI